MTSGLTGEPDVRPSESVAAPRLSSVVARLSLVNVLVAAASFLTGPLQARALGPTGRGELAAIIVPLALAPQILGLALGAYAARESASGRYRLNEIIGSVGFPLLVVGAIGMAGAAPAAGALAAGNDTVQTYLTIGFLLLPVGLLGVLGAAVLAGLERWTLLMATKLIPVVILFVGVAGMYILGEMTVGRMAMLTLAAGGLSAVPAAVVMARAGPPVFRWSVTRASIVFGLRSWPGFLAQLTNARLDQLFMITLVTSRELGLYAVAVSLAGVSAFLSGALGPPLLSRVARGETAIVARGLRVTLSVMTVANLAMGAITPFVLPLLFGEDFGAAVGPTLVLLAAGVPLAGISVLSAALMADGAPGAPSVGEILALAVTIPGLVLLLPAIGGMGAAAVSLVAYTTSFIYQLVIMQRRLGGSLGSYVLLRREDLVWARAMMPRPLRSPRGR